MSALELCVQSIGFYSPWAPSWADARSCWRAEAVLPDHPAPRPQPSVLAPTERRRAPDSVAIALEVAASACAAAGIQPSELPSVFASTYGDLAISDYMCDTLASAPTQISPTRFHNSVHNAAAGYWTIGTHCMQASSAVCAGAGTFAEALLEAGAQALADRTPVLLVSYDIEARGPLAQVCRSRGLLAHALIIAPAQGDSTHRLSLSLTRAALTRDSTDELSARHREHPLLASLELFQAIAREQSAQVVLPAGSGALTVVYSP